MNTPEIKIESFPSAVNVETLVDGRILGTEGKVKRYSKIVVVYNEDEIIYNYYGDGGFLWLTHEIRTWKDEIKRG